jgi:hypothetical protein
VKKVLLGLAALSTVAMADFIPMTEARGDDVKFKMRNTDRVGRNRTETELNNIRVTENTYIDFELTNDHYHNSSKQNVDYDLETFTQLSENGRWELYTNLEVDQKSDNSVVGYIDVMPTYMIARNEKGFSLIRAGIGYQWGEFSDDTDNAMRYVAEFKNIYVPHDRVELEFNAYYTGHTDSTDDGYDSLAIIEAYAYLNYPLYESEKFNITALYEAGIDPYSFGERETGGKDSEGYVNGEEGGYEDNYFYSQPTVRATYTTDKKVDFWVEGGHYSEWTNGKGVDNTDDDGLYVQIGIKSKF